MAKIACIGAGNVGRAWAVVFARAGHDVALYDVSAEEIETRALPLAARTIDLLAENGFLAEPAATVLARIRPFAALEEAVAGAELVQESVREDVEIKRQVIREIGRHAPAGAMIASSTSAIPGSQFLGEAENPGRALVAHPVNPPALIPIVELCAAETTAPDTIERAASFYEGVGMKPVRVLKEIDGFILNRLQYTLVAEALHLVGEGYCSAEDIDAIVRDGLALRWASLGPFEVAHLNSTHGFLGFVDQLGPMMRRMGESARTDYDWDRSLAELIHGRLAQKMPLDRIGDMQAWRDRRILATRKMQDGE
jgi:3-hydroxyacyl-CoA dehydrogenase